MDAGAMRQLQSQRIETDGQTEDKEEIEKNGMMPRGANEPDTQGEAGTGAALEFRDSFRNQKIGNKPAGRVSLLRGEIHCHTRDIALVGAGAARNTIDSVAASIARFEIAGRVDPGRIAAKLFIDSADPLEDFTDVETRERPQAPESARSRTRAESLTAGLLTRDFRERTAGLFDFHLGRGQGVFFALEQFGKRPEKGAVESVGLGIHHGEHGLLRLFVLAPTGDEAVGPQICGFPMLLRIGGISREPGELLEKCKPKKLREIPEFRGGQRTHLLEFAERV